MIKLMEKFQDIKSIRHANYVYLINVFTQQFAAEYGKTHGAIAAFAKKIGKEASYASQLKNENRPLGDDIVREIESALGLEYGWMDVSHDISESGKAIAKLWESLPHEKQEQIRNYLLLESALSSPRQEALERIKSIVSIYFIKRGKPLSDAEVTEHAIRILKFTSEKTTTEEITALLES